MKGLLTLPCKIYLFIFTLHKKLKNLIIINYEINTP